MSGLSAARAVNSLLQVCTSGGIAVCTSSLWVFPVCTRWVYRRRWLCFWLCLAAATAVTLRLYSLETVTTRQYQSPRPTSWNSEVTRLTTAADDLSGGSNSSASEEIEMETADSNNTDTLLLYKDIILKGVQESDSNDTNLDVPQRNQSSVPIWKYMQQAYPTGSDDYKYSLAETERRIQQGCATDNVYGDPQSQTPSFVQYGCRLLQICKAERERVPASNHGNPKTCPCLPPLLKGWLPLTYDARLENTTWSALNSSIPDPLPGGHWRPLHCAPLRRVAVIIPFRDREHHLRAFLGHMHPILQRQMVEYQVFVVEQNMPYIFNKGALMNIGFLEAMRRFTPDCVLFHDVDTLIERDDNMAVCGDIAVHFAAYADRHQYKFHASLFGAAVLLSAADFQRINGFSNLFYGWGMEDDEFKFRVMGKRRDSKAKPSIYRPPLDIGRCTILQHERDVTFEKEGYSERFRMFAHMTRDLSWGKTDGLTTVTYEVVASEDRPLYSWIHVNLKEQVTEFKKSTDANANSGWLLNNLSGRSSVLYKYYVQRALKHAFGSSTWNRYVIANGTCGDNMTTPARHYVSAVTCHYICDGDPHCYAVQYHKGNAQDVDYFCDLLRTPCFNILRTTNDDVQVHQKVLRRPKVKIDTQVQDKTYVIKIRDKVVRRRTEHPPPDKHDPKLDKHNPKLDKDNPKLVAGMVRGSQLDNTIVIDRLRHAWVGNRRHAWVGNRH